MPARERPAQPSPTVDHDLHAHDGSADGVTTMFEFLTLHRRAVPSASFVFVLSDFIEPTPLATWEWALDRGWDVVPVVIQDPTWEQGFPDVDRLVLPLVGPDGRVRAVRLEKGESRRWRERHEARLAEPRWRVALAGDRAGARVA